MDRPIMTPGVSPYRGLNLMKGGLILFGSFLMMFFFTVFAQSAVNALVAPGTRTNLLICSTLQGVMLFGIPALIWSAITSGSGFARTLCLDRGFTLRAIIGGLAVFAVAIPALNVVIDLNASMSLPWPEVEKLFRTWEKTAEEQTKILLDTTSAGGLISGILCVGLITGVCEELFFRGALQGLLTRGGINHHAAIWIAATIFSLAHFQFFGFFPRILLGAFFGYVFYWTQSLWLNALLHAFNNSVVVVTTWFAARGSDFDKTPFAEFFDGPGLWPMAIGSALATALILYFLRKWIFAPLLHEKSIGTSLPKDTE